jgi:hypothetical protein
LSRFPNPILLRAILPVSLAMVAPAWAQTTFVTDASQPGQAFSPGVRGQAIPAVTIDRGEYVTGVPKALEVSNGSSLRGVAGGLEADTFNWKTRNNSPRAGTLDYLRHSRNYNANLYITANIRGLVEPDPTTPGNQRFYDTSIPTLASLAGDWVRYTNHIVQTYRQGQTITDTRDQDILNSLTWSSSFPNDNFDKLLSTTEAAVPKVKYWEIGNEPRVGLLSTYKVTNSYTFSATTADATHKTDFAQRYAALTSAMLAEDPTIKVGPAIQYLSGSSEQAVIDTILKRQPDGTLLPVDFLGYHPYQKLNEQTTSVGIEAGLRAIYPDHQSKINNIRSRISGAGRDPNSVALVASEHNASNHSSNDSTFEATMAHALGNTETVFSFARLGVQDAHYWVWPAHRWDGTEYPAFLASKKLRDSMGDTILAADASSSDNLHLYTTRDSKSKQVSLWGLNFSNDVALSRTTAINNVGGRGKITLYTLGATVGATTLMSSNLASDMAGGPTRTVDWKSLDMTGTRLDTLSLSYPASTITLLTIDPWKQVALPGDANADGFVNAVDASIVSSNMNSNERNWWQGDFNGDGLVNATDAAVQSANNGQSTGNKWLMQAGSWSTRTNWQTGVVPNAVGASAYLASSITAGRTVTVGGNITLGSLQFDNANSYLLSGVGSIKLSNLTTTSARVYVVQGSHKIDVPLTLVSSSIIDVAAQSSLRIGKPVTVPTGKTLSQTGAGSLTFDSSLTMQSGGRFVVAPGNHLVTLGSLSMVASSTIDLNDSDLVVNTGSYAAIYSKVMEGYRDFKDTAATGIISSSGQIAVGHPILALFDNALLKATDWPFSSGNSVGASAIIGKYTYLGDADLNGMVTPDDYGAVDANLGAHVGTTGGMNWLAGDWNLDGDITPDDYTAVDSNLGLGQTMPLAANGLSVPEPGMPLMILGAAAVLRGRRRRIISA